ncbi:MAG: hypothetical protein AAFX79_07345 [Planctomycetota bacterium]
MTRTHAIAAHLCLLALAAACIAQDAPDPLEQVPPPAEEPRDQPAAPPEEQPAAPAAEEPLEPLGPPDAWSRVPDLDARLAALDGRDAMAYLELAEEVADETGSAEDRLLSRQLYAIAYAVERETGRRPEVIAGACLGLAQIEPTDDRAAWLRAVAGLIDARATQAPGATVGAAAVPPEVGLRAAEALGLARAGQGRRAQRLYDDEDVRLVFDRYGDLLGGSGGLSGLRRFERALGDWPDAECGGARVVTRRVQDGRETRHCPICHGNPGPPLSEGEFLAHLRFESRLLRGIHQSWGAQVVVDRGAPLIDPDPDEVLGQLLARYGIDAGRRLWRNGAWARSDSSAPTPGP